MPCDKPTTIPEGPMNDGPAERAWVADRIALAGCTFRFKAVVDFYTERDKGLSEK